MKQVIDELKKGFAVTSICNRNFLAKDALFLTGVITFNLLICINRIALHRKLQTGRRQKKRLAAAPAGQRRSPKPETVG